MRIIRIGVAGLGAVGGEVVRLLRQNRSEFARKLQADLRVTAVCDRRVSAKATRLRLSSGVLRTRSYQELLGVPSLDVIVETMGGLGDARKLVIGALNSGRHVVTANKQLLAHHWDEIVSASRKNAARVRFEAAVAGGIPILQAIHQSLAGNRVERVLGILNGTTNFILTRMEQDGGDLKAALAEAQRLGLAESDPTLDLDGSDAAHKVSVIASLLTGQSVRSTAISRDGINAICPEDILFAKSELGRVVRLLGVATFDWKLKPVQVTGWVAPTLVPSDHPLAAVHGQYNAVMVEASEAGDLMFYGKGAGGGPAASAVVGDLFMLSQEILDGAAAELSDPLWARGPKIRVRPVQETVSAYYLRIKVADRPGVLSRITGILGRSGISISKIHQGDGKASRSREVSLFITTHPTLHRQMEKAIGDILRLSSVSRSHTWLRML